MDVKEFIEPPEGYFFNYSQGIYQILDPKFKNRLDVFLQRFLIIQQSEKKPTLPQNLIADFPFVVYKPFKKEIDLRREDLRILEILWKRESEPKTVLEIGGWNGWLSSWLSRKNCQIVTADIFSDETNGLGTKRFHQNSHWLSVQTDLEDISIYKKKFDLIIFNHCLQFLPEPLVLINRYRQLLTLGGHIIILGASFHKLQKRQAEKKLRFKEHYMEKYAFDIHFYSSKGYFNVNDFKKFKTLGFSLISYKHTFAGTIKRKITGEKSGVMCL
jgi:SAM-dependent methyltransferase